MTESLSSLGRLKRACRKRSNSSSVNCFGAGVTADALAAAKWHFIAKAGGEQDEVLEKLAAKLSKADRAKAEQAASAWREAALAR